MKSRDLIFILIVLAVVGGLYYLSTKNKAKPMPPNPPDHFTATTREECFKCHSTDTLASLEQQHKHPGKWKDERVSCLLCHTTPQGSKANNFRKTEREAGEKERESGRVGEWEKEELSLLPHSPPPSLSRSFSPASRSLLDFKCYVHSQSKTKRQI